MPVQIIVVITMLMTAFNVIQKGNCGTPILPLRDLLQPNRLDGEYRKPTNSELHMPFLRKLLGQYYEPALMSMDAKFSLNWQKSRMSTSSKIGSRLRRVVKRIPKLNRKERKRLLKSLSKVTNCPLYERWEDLGDRYWPRWVKQTSCEIKKSKSCSIPSGMWCTNSRTVKYKLLYWYCETVNRCRWVKVVWPLTTSCTCSCLS